MQDFWRRALEQRQSRPGRPHTRRLRPPDMTGGSVSECCDETVRARRSMQGVVEKPVVDGHRLSRTEQHQGTDAFW